MKYSNFKGKSLRFFSLVFALLLGLVSAEVVSAAGERGFVSINGPDEFGVAVISINVEGVPEPGFRGYAFELDFIDSDIIRLVDGPILKGPPPFGADNVSNFRDKVSCSTVLRTAGDAQIPDAGPSLLVADSGDESGIPLMQLQSGQGQMMIASAGAQPISCAANGSIDLDTGQYVCAPGGDITGQTGNGSIAEFVCYIGPDVVRDRFIDMNLRVFVNANGDPLAGIVRLDETGSELIISDLTPARLYVGGEPALKSDTPTVNPVKVGDSSVSGQSTEAEETVITVSVNGVEVATGAVDASGNWTVTLPQALQSGDTVSATATASGETESDPAEGVFGNSPPVVENPGDLTSAEGDAINLQILASDPDNDSFTFGATGLPDGLTISSSGLITGSVSFSAAPANTVAVTATDTGGLFHTVNFSWTITDTNRAPEVTNPGDQTNAEDENVNLQIAASDPDNNGFTFGATGLPDGLAISASGLISGKVSFDAAPANAVAVTATDDGGLFHTVNFSWTITNTNRAPEVTNPGDQANAEDDDVTLQIVATDPDGDNLVFSATDLPKGLTISSSGLISGKVDFDAAATNSVVVKVTDDGAAPLNSTVNFNWPITNTNRAPEVTNPGDQANAENDDVTLQIVATDPDSDNLTFSATGLPKGLTISSSGLITGKVDFDAAATNSVAVKVTDDGAAPLSSTVNFNWPITNTNQAPEVTNPGDQANAEEDDVSLQIVATDPDSDSLIFSATGLPKGLTISASGLISGTVALDAEATNAVAVKVTDNGTPELSTTVNFNWPITNTNQAPDVTNPGDQANAEEDDVTLQIVATDPDDDSLIFSATGLPKGLTISASGLISGTVALDAEATNAVAVKVTDNGTPELSTTVNFNWPITNTNQAPDVTNPGDQANAENDDVTLQIVATDPDDDSLTFIATGLPKGLTISASGLISGAVALDAAETNSVVVTVTDDGSPPLSSTVNFNWPITNTNQAPEVTNPGDQTDAENDDVELQIIAIDPDSDGLTFSATDLPDGLTISASGLITGTVTFDAAETNAVAVTVTDDGSPPLSSTVNFNWPITNTNRAPVADIQLPANVETGVEVQADGSSSIDPDNDQFDFAWDLVGPEFSTAGLNDPTIAMPTFTPDEEGEYVLTLVVTDEHGLASELQMTTTFATDPLVENIPPNASISVNSQQVTVGDLVELDGTASNDPDEQPGPFTYNWELNKPPNSNSALDDTASDMPSFTPDEVGEYQVFLTVNDGEADSNTVSVVITVVAANVPPVADAGIDQEITFGDSAIIDAGKSNDPDGSFNELSFSWSIVTPVGSTADIINPESAEAEFIPDAVGMYVLRVDVTDIDGAVSSDQVTINVIEPVVENIPPVADAGDDQEITLGDDAVLNAGNSSDPDGDFNELSFSWSFVNTPDGSAITDADISNSDSDVAQFTPDVAGDYELQVDVTDIDGAVSSDRVIIAVTKPAEAIPGDLSGDTVIDGDDYNIFRSTLGKCEGDVGYLLEADYDSDGCISYGDYRIWYSLFLNQD